MVQGHTQFHDPVSNVRSKCRVQEDTSNRVQPTRVNPDASEVARANIAKLEKALEVMEECKGLAVGRDPCAPSLNGCGSSRQAGRRRWEEGVSKLIIRGAEEWHGVQAAPTTVGSVPCMLLSTVGLVV